MEPELNRRLWWELLVRKTEIEAMLQEVMDGTYKAKFKTRSTVENKTKPM